MKSIQNHLKRDLNIIITKMNTSFNINNLKGLHENNKREKLVEVLNNQNIERNNENKRKRKFPTLFGEK
jgi:predicted methyltransferase